MSTINMIARYGNFEYEFKINNKLVGIIAHTCIDGGNPDDVGLFLENITVDPPITPQLSKDVIKKIKEVIQADLDCLDEQL
jgi:hypothetical protein